MSFPWGSLYTYKKIVVWRSETCDIPSCPQEVIISFRRMIDLDDWNRILWNTMFFCQYSRKPSTQSMSISNFSDDFVPHLIYLLYLESHNSISYPVVFIGGLVLSQPTIFIFKWNYFIILPFLQFFHPFQRGIPSCFKIDFCIFFFFP